MVKLNQRRPTAYFHKPSDSSQQEHDKRPLPRISSGASHGKRAGLRCLLGCLMVLGMVMYATRKLDWSAWE